MKRLIAVLALAGPLCASELPGQYVNWIKAALQQVESRLAAEPNADLETLETAPGWKHFPSSVLMAAVLVHRGDKSALPLARRIGDRLCAEQEKGRYNTRLDHHRDTYMWLEAYRLLERDLDDARRERWKRALMDNLVPLAADVAKRQDYPWYQSPYIGTSPNHYSLWSSTIYLAGLVFHNPEWEKLGAKIMHRFAAEEQAPDGYWGEHSRAGPTTNYDYLTMTGVALYAEYSKDPAAMQALRRSTDFHKYFTYPDGLPVETVNDRNRYGYISMWGSFGFSHFADGRRYAEFLAAHYPAERISLEMLGRMAQDALYYHEGSAAPIPQDQERFAHQLSIPAGIRKSGPWVVCLSGIIATQAALSQFYLDRQSALSVFHQKYGLIVTGANSKRQPELATFSEKVAGQLFYLPLSSRLRMGDNADQLALAYNSFFTVMDVRVDKGVSVRAAITPKNRSAEARFTLQLCLKAGEALETGAGRKVTLDATPLDEPAGGWIRHHGWTLRVDPAARLVWPVYPFNPYANGPEKGLEHAAGALSVSFRPEPREIAFEIN